MNFNRCLCSLGLGFLAAGAIALPATIAQTKPVDPLTATPAAIPGWQAIRGRGAELWLPSQFKGGEPSDQILKSLLANMAALGPEAATLGKLIAQNPTSISLLAVDPQPSTAEGVALVIVGSAAVPSMVTLDLVLQYFDQALPPQVKVLDRRMTKVQNQDAARFVTEIKHGPVSAKQVTYVIKQDTLMWTINYTTGAENYAQRLPIFEQSIQTFRSLSDNKTSHNLAHPSQASAIQMPSEKN